MNAIEELEEVIHHAQLQGRGPRTDPAGAVGDIVGCLIRVVREQDKRIEELETRLSLLNRELRERCVLP